MPKVHVIPVDFHHSEGLTIVTFDGTEGEGEGVGGFSSKQTYNYTKVLLKKLILAEDFWKKSSQNHNSQLESQVVKRLSAYL